MSRTLKTVLIVGGIVLGVIIIASVVEGLVRGYRNYGYGMMGPFVFGGYGGMILMPILGLALVGLIIWAVVAAAQRPGDSGGSSSRSDTALDILKRRYASGEITKEEYEQKKKDIGG